MTPVTDNILPRAAALAETYVVMAELSAEVRSLREMLGLELSDVAYWSHTAMWVVEVCDGQSENSTVPRAELERLVAALAGFVAGRADHEASAVDQVHRVARLADIQLDLRHVCPLPLGW